MVASKPYHIALMKTLDESVIPLEFTLIELTNIFATMSVQQQSLGFSNEDLSPLGKYHNQALHITVEARRISIPYVMIDNGPTINVCLLKIAVRLGIDVATLEDSLVAVRAYDNTERDVLGSLMLDLRMGPQRSQWSFKLLIFCPILTCCWG